MMQKNNWVNRNVNNLSVVENETTQETFGLQNNETIDGLTGNHTKPIKIVFQKPDGRSTTNYLENITLLNH